MRHHLFSLQKVDLNILKLDSAYDYTIKLLNNPAVEFSVEKLVENMLTFKGKLVIQTMFITGRIGNVRLDNTGETEVSAWLKLITKVNPWLVMIYTISRDAPIGSLEKVPLEKLEEIAERVKLLGIDVQVSG